MCRIFAVFLDSFAWETFLFQERRVPCVHVFSCSIVWCVWHNWLLPLVINWATVKRQTYKQQEKYVRKSKARLLFCRLSKSHVIHGNSWPRDDVFAAHQVAFISHVMQPHRVSGPWALFYCIRDTSQFCDDLRLKA